MALPTRVNRPQGYVEPFDAAQREFDSMLSRFFGGRDIEGCAFAPYGVDVREDADHLYVEAELPGFRKEDVNITVENQTLNISAERKEDRKEGGDKKGEWLLRERRYNRYQRSFTLPQNVNDQKCDAKLNDGVLTITLDKREESKPRKVQVN
jgi:HSP20 family molecular chaperone IbpA